VSGAGNAVQVLLAGMEGNSLQAAAAAFHGAAAYVELAGEVTPPEVAAWAHSTFDADELSRLRELDWAELVRKARGIPRLVRWELERRLATGDLAAALRQGTPEALEGGVAPVQSAKDLAVVPLPTARPSLQAPVTARSGVGMRVDAAADEAKTLLVRIPEELRCIAFRARAAMRESADAGRRSARLLGQVLRQAATQIRDGAAPHTERAATFMADWWAGASGRGRRALSHARSWSARRSARIALTARIRFTEASRRGASTLRALVSRTRRTTETLALALAAFTARRVPAIREAARRGAERTFELARVTRRAFSDLRGSKRFRQMSEMRAGPLAVFALVAGAAFLLGRMSALPNVTGGAHGPPPRAPAVVSSAPPPEGGQDQTIAPQPREGAQGAQNREETGPSPPLYGPPAHPENTPRAAVPQHILVKIDSRPRARIWIDGHDVGRTPLARVPLAPGRHHFQVLFADGRKIHRIVEIRHGTHVVKFS
jgi:hypothetical protein